MKSKHLLAISLLGAASWLGAQNLDWYTYWGSDAAGSEITPRKIRVDRQGDIYAAATFGGTEVDIMGEKTASNSSVSNGDAVIVKLGADNQLIWKKTLAGSGTATVADMELDAEGNLFVAGDFSTLLQPDDSHSMPLDMPTGYEMEAAYVIRFSPEGEVLHMWQMPSEGIQVYDLALDAEGNVYVAGWFDSEMTFDGNPDNLQGSTSKTAQLYVAKYNASGELQSLVTDDQATYSNVFVDVDTDGSLFVAATFMGTTTLAGTTLTTPSTAGNMLLAKYDAEGNALWAKRIGGTWTDTAIGVEVSGFGDVAICGNYLSEDITVTGFGDDEYFNNGFPNLEATERPYYHIGLFTFNKENGDYRWWYTFGQGSTATEGSCMANYIHCTDEGVWYVGGRASSRYGDSSTINFGNAKSGIRLMDGTWVQHNTNGGADALYLVLNREGQLCSIGRPGSAQTEDIIDAALSPDKSSIYLFYNMLTRANQVIYTYIDNFWDSFTDINKFGRTGNYTQVRVFSSEAPDADNKYQEVVGFSSALIAKYDFPAINPGKLPVYTPGEAYSQAFTQDNAQGTSKFYTLLLPEGLAFDDSHTLAGTLAEDSVYYFGVVLTDSTALPGEITYYAQDPNHESIRGNSAVVRYLRLATTEEEEPGLSGIEAATGEADGTFFPTLCTDQLHVQTTAANYQVVICDLSGKVAGQYDNARSISVGQLPAGIYFARLLTPQGCAAATKFVKR